MDDARPPDTPPAPECADAETAEAEFMYALESGAPPHVARELGISTTRIAGGVALAMRQDPAGGYWNKSLGLGLTEPVTAQVLDSVLDFYRDSGSGVACLQVAPQALPQDWGDLCAARGIVAGSSWVKLVRDASPAPGTTTDLRVGPVTREDARAWGEVYCVGFGMPVGPLADMVAAVLDNPSFHPLAAWDGDEALAGANLSHPRDLATFSGAATLEKARGRGAQSTFFHRRVELARAAGARLMVAETWAEGEGQHNPSLHNMRRAGFRDLYVRQNWVWHSA
jgi:hypothetical protein